MNDTESGYVRSYQCQGQSPIELAFKFHSASKANAYEIWKSIEPDFDKGTVRAISGRHICMPGDIGERCACPIPLPMFD
jgi:hypothetical protein